MPFFLGKAVKHSEDGKRAANDEEVRNAGKLDPRRIPRSNPLILLDDHYGCNLEQPSVCLVFFCMYLCRSFGGESQHHCFSKVE